MHPATAFLKTIASSLERISNQRILQRMSIKETRILAEKLVRSLDEEFDVVVGIKRGGIPAATYVARRLELPLEVIAISHYSKSLFKEIPYIKKIDARIHVIEKPSLEYRYKKALLVDDDSRSGKTLQTGKRLFGGEVKTGVLVDFQKGGEEQDYHGMTDGETGLFVMWPWTECNPNYIIHEACVL